jgi:hypothetical protein
MSTPVMQPHDFLGLFELDIAGTVIYSSLEKPNGQLLADTDIKGRDFFKEILPFANIEEFRRRFDLFRLGDAQASGFDFVCDYGERSVPVKVLLARLRARGELGESVLVHLRKG